jgi:LCP family protein required for cell wall assembly
MAAAEAPPSAGWKDDDMNRLIQSAILGGGCAGVMLLTVFAGVSIARPGWLRALFRNPVAAAVEASGVVATPEPGRPTVEPLPDLGAAGYCGAPETMTLAILGVDSRYGHYDIPARTDAIMLVNLRLDEKEAGVLSIPRDLWIPYDHADITGIPEQRINLAYLNGEQSELPGGGPQLFKDTVALNFGVLPERYVMVNFEAFVGFVDALGGIEVDVPTYIWDPEFPNPDGEGVVEFYLEPGPQTLDGRTALMLARTRHMDNDYERIKRQQLVALAIRDKLMSGNTLTRLPALLQAIQGAIRTDLTADEIAMLICAAPEFEREAITTVAVGADDVTAFTTSGGAAVSLPIEDRITALVDEFLGR